MKLYKIFIFIFSVIALLAALSVCFPENGINIFGKQLFFPSLEEVMTADGSAAESKTAVADVDIFQIQKQNALNDTLNIYRDFFETHPARFYLPTDSAVFFDTLFMAMENCRRDTSLVHILHYGDSQIESDRITGFLRQKLQERFGGAGAGLQPLVQVIPSASVGQSASENIERYTVSGMHRNVAGHSRYGILGQAAKVDSGGTVSFAARNWKNTFPNLKKWTSVRLFVNRSGANFSANFSSKPLTERKKMRTAEKNPYMLKWSSADSIRRFSIAFTGSAELAAVSLDGDCGVTVDNIPFRGSSGTFFTQIDTATVATAMNELNVMLVLLQFGGNSIPYLNSEKSRSQYAGDIAEQIKYFRKIRPKAKIVLIGPSDMSTKVKGKLQTYPNMEAVIEMMKNTAVANGAAFWSMYDAMGGHNSMIDWVKQRPQLAVSDYIHFSQLGADKIAEIFYNSLMNYYEYYLFLKRQ